MTKDFWHSRAYLCAVLLILSSTLLPQVCGLCSLYCWFVPMKVWQRGWVLLFCGYLGHVAFLNQTFIGMISIVLRTILDM